MSVFFKVSVITDISKLTLKELLSYPRTKNSLIKIFAHKAIELLNQEKKIYVVRYQRQIDSNIPSWTQFSRLHEEANTLLLCVVREITLFNPQSSIFIKMVSPDTDVFVLCVHHFSILQHLPGLDMEFELYIKDRRLILVNKCIAGLGEQ